MRHLAILAAALFDQINPLPPSITGRGKSPSSKPLAWTIHDARGDMVWCGTVVSTRREWTRRAAPGFKLRDHADRVVAVA